MRFINFFKSLSQMEFQARFASLAIFAILSLSVLLSYQNCSKQRFSSIEQVKPACATPPCTACNFSGASIVTDPATDYRINQDITFYVDENIYSTIAWSFFKDTNNNSEPDSNELIPNTPTNTQPVLSFTSNGTYIAVARLSRDNNGTVACETTIQKLIPITDGSTCTDPTGINGPILAYVGDTQIFSIAKPSCFQGTANWDMDIPRNGAPNGNEHTNVSTNNPVIMVYDADHASSNNGLYTIKSVVTGNSTTYELFKDIEVRFKSCTFNGQTIPGNGTVFTAFNLLAGTCSTGCVSKQFRCNNGIIVPVDGISNIADYPHAECTPVDPGSCVGNPPPPSQDPQIIYSKTENGSVTKNFEYFTDNYYGRILNAGPNARSCTTADVDYPLHQSQDVGLTGCDGNPMQDPWRNLSQTINHMNWESYSNGQNWRYVGVHQLLDHPILYPGKYKTCVYNPDTQKNACVFFNLTSRNPELFFTKTDSASGPHNSNFNRATDSYYGRVLNVGKNVRGCSTATNLDPNLTACNGNPEVQGAWKSMTNSEWARLGTGLKYDGVHTLSNHPYLTPANYKTCFYSQITGKNTCVNYTISETTTPPPPGQGPAPTLYGCLVDTDAWDISQERGCFSMGCTSTNTIVFSVGHRLSANSPDGHMGDHFEMINPNLYTYQWTVARGGAPVNCAYGTGTQYTCVTSENLPNGIYDASVTVRRKSDGQTWTFSNIRAEKSVRTRVNGVCPEVP